VLASDREREATVLRLRAAHLEGRIETDEFEKRVSRAQAAGTRAELDAIEADLPERITVRFRDLGDRRTLVLAHGVAPLGIRRAFARMSD
jgi:hypothetical protein